MKIKVKGFKSLIKAVRNRAHLFPVKVLIRAKSKTYYGIRYKTGNKAMEFTKKQMKIPNTVEVLFDTIDGKRKNLTENDVLRIYDKAGKPGSLQEFIEKNFKKPYVKPRNSTKVDLEQQQMSIDDLMERNKKAKEPEKSLIEIAEEKARKLKENPQPIDSRVGNTEPYKSRVTKEQVEEAKAFFNDKNTEIFPYDKGVRDDEGQFSDKEVVDAANFRMRMILEYNKEIEHEKNGLSNPYLNKESLVRNYKYYKIFNDILLNREEVAYWNEALKEGRTELYKLQNFDERYMAKKRLEEKKKRKEQKQENSNSTNPLETEILNTLGIKFNNKSDTTKLKPKFNALKKLIGKKGDVINGKPLTERASKEIDQILKNATFNLDEMKISVESGNNYLQNLLDEALNRKVEEIKAETQVNGADPDALAEQNQALEGKRAKQKLRENSKEYVEEYKQRNTLDDLNARDRFGTKKIESKGEYQQVANINELIDKAKAIKDYHVDIKGRAILDMLGVNLPMYSKRNGKHFTGKTLGYCRYKIDNETLEVRPYEIGIVAETNNSRRETDAIIHEAMHVKIKGIKQNTLNLCDIKGGLLEGEVSHNVEESLVEMAGFSLSKTIHGSENYKEIMAYPEEIAFTLPRIWDVEEFKTARKTGINGIGKEIYNQIMAGNKEFIDNVVNTYVSDEAKKKAAERTTAIEKTMLDRTDKLEKITGGNEESPIGNLVEELKRGTISLQAALNSSEYGVIAAVLITKFLEDEDLDGIDALIAAL